MMSNFIKRLPEHKPDVTKVGLGKVIGINIMTSDRKCFLQLEFVFCIFVDDIFYNRPGKSTMSTGPSNPKRI